MGICLEKESTIRFKILTHFIKGKISLTPIDTILTIPRELKYMEVLVKLTKKHKNEKHKIVPTNVVAQQLPTIHHININKNHKSKTLHLWVGINNYIMEGLVNIGASMSVLVVAIVRELGIMHLVIRD